MTEADPRTPAVSASREGRQKRVKPRRKHTPGRGHRRKSEPQKRRKFRKKRDMKRQEALENARRQWQQWDSFSDEQKLLLSDLRPTQPRPENGN